LCELTQCGYEGVAKNMRIRGVCAMNTSLWGRTIWASELIGKCGYRRGECPFIALM